MITYVLKIRHPNLRHCSRFVSFQPHPAPFLARRSYSQLPQPGPICPPPKPPPKSPNLGTKYTVGTAALIAAATIGYARYDPAFRQWMGENVPYADGFFRVVFQEERTFKEELMTRLEKIGDLMGKKKRIKDDPLKEKENTYAPPHAVFPSLMKEEKEEKFNEIRVQKDPETVDIVTEKPKSVQTLSSYHPKTIGELELKIGDSASKAVAAYLKAQTALKDYNRDIEVIVEDSVEQLDPRIWTSLKRKTDAKTTVLKEAEDSAEKAVKDVELLRGALNDPDLEAPDTARATARRNVDRVLTDIATAKADFEAERKVADLTEKYWKKVEAARCHFIDELETIFPDFDIKKKKFTMTASDLDLFLVHAFAHVLYLQKELKRVETVGQMRLKAALDRARKGDPNFSLVEVAIQEGIEREKRHLTEEFQKTCLKLRKESERELRHRLKCQEQAHVDHLADRLSMREQELEREFNRKLDEQIMNEQSKYKTQMAGMIARMKGMKNAIVERVEADKIAHQSQVLWSACQALHRAVKSSIPGVPWREQIKPLHIEVDAIKNAAAENDELVATVLAGIPAEALDRGVYPEGAIRERFLKVERVARRLALVPEDGGRLPLYFLSFIQSMLLVNAPNPIPQAELNDEKTDFGKLDTYDILQRARYWMDRGNYAQTLKYMNLLRGASRCVAHDWMRETRILLETQQAAETLMAHAVAGGLLHL